MERCALKHVTTVGIVKPVIESRGNVTILGVLFQDFNHLLVMVINCKRILQLSSLTIIYYLIKIKDYCGIIRLRGGSIIVESVGIFHPRINTLHKLIN